MSYTIKYSGGTITIPIGQANVTSTPLTLVGRNWTANASMGGAAAGYGQALNQNFVSLLENFANTAQPTNPVKGQFWYDTSASTMKMNVGNTTSPAWSSLYTSSTTVNSLTNGNTQVSVPIANGDVVFDVTGTSSVMTVTSTGVVVIGDTSSNIFISTVNDGVTAPFSVLSNVLVANLNADTVDGYHASTTTNALGEIVVRDTVDGIIYNDIEGNVTTANLTVTGKSTLGNVANIKITGGTVGQFLTTDGAGNLAWATGGGGGGGGSSLANGSSNLAVTTTTVNVSADGNANVLVITSTGIEVIGDITTNNITTGANTTAGNITGDWTLTAGSRLTSTYADLAEYYVSDMTAGPATVVEFGGRAEITVCMTDMSRRVAGVVSTDPAFIMNTDSVLTGQQREAVALQGRVPCKVIGTVSKGDMMVSAGNGCARAESEPTIGSVIGKALEDKSDAELGIIEIAVGRL